MTIELSLIGSRPRPATTSRDDDWISLPWMAMGRWIDNYLLPWGMAHEQGREGMPPWPEYADFGVTQEEVEVYEIPDEANPPGEPPEHVRRYMAADALTMSYAPEVPGIPVWKIGSNDNWIITPIECAGALRKWEDAGSPLPPNERDRGAWEHFIDLLRAGVEGEGLRTS